MNTPLPLPGLDDLAQFSTRAAVAGGHIGVFVSRAQHKLREQIVTWLEKR